MSKLISIAVGAAIFAASAVAGAQTGGTSQPSGTMSKPDSMAKPSPTSHDFKAMDTNSDGMISRDEYVAYYGTRFDRMKRNDKGMVMMNDMMTWDGGASAVAKPGTPNPAGKNRSN